jgi:preprotein translocase subunit SecA
MNAQRKAIYKKRKHALFGDRLDLDIDNMFYDTSESMVYAHDKSNFEAFDHELLRVVGIQSPVTEDEYASIDDRALVDKVYDAMRSHYDRKNERIGEMALPQIKHVFETMSDKYQNIVLPLTDGKKEMPLVINLESAVKSGGKEISKSFEKNIILGMIDNEWKEHLREMDDLRSAVNNAQYEQKDPLLVYKLESFELFKSMLGRLNGESIELLMKLNLKVSQEIESTNKAITPQSNYAQAQATSAPSKEIAGREGYSEAIQNSANREPVKQQPIVTEKTVGRNDPCPCGSGKKFKQCHGK